MIALGKKATGETKPEPLAVAKRRDILRAATEAFLDQGYLAASMDDIALSASVSKPTIYKHFGSKKALFEEIIRGRVVGLIAPLHVDAHAGASVSEVLTAFARQYVNLILQPSSLALYRVVVFEAGHNDEMGANSYRVGGAVAVKRIADFLATQTELGRLSVANPSIAAEQFIGALTGHFQLRALLGVGDRPTPQYCADYIETAVRAFLRAYTAEASL